MVGSAVRIPFTRLGARSRGVLHALCNDLVNRMEVAPSDRLLHELLSFRFERDYHLISQTSLCSALMQLYVRGGLAMSRLPAGCVPRAGLQRRFVP